MNISRITLTIFLLAGNALSALAGSGAGPVSVELEGMVEAEASIVSSADLVTSPAYLAQADPLGWGGLLAIIATMALMLFPVLMIRFFPASLRYFLPQSANPQL